MDEVDVEIHVHRMLPGQTAAQLLPGDAVLARADAFAELGEMEEDKTYPKAVTDGA